MDASEFTPALPDRRATKRKSINGGTSKERQRAARVGTLDGGGVPLLSSSSRGEVERRLLSLSLSPSLLRLERFAKERQPSHIVLPHSPIPTDKKPSPLLGEYHPPTHYPQPSVILL